MNVKKLVPEKMKIILKPLYRKYLFTRLLLQYKLNFRSTIKEMNVEFANFCNLRCKWCSLNHSKEKIILNKDIFEKFLKELVLEKKFRSVKDLNLWNAGEVLLNKDLIDLLKLLKKYKINGIQKNGSFPRINLLTNGMLLSKEMSKKIVSLDVLDKLMFSFDGGTKKDYKEIRRGGKWDILIKNIDDFVKINKGKVTSEIICMVGPEKPLSRDWMDKDFKEVLFRVDIVSLRHPHDWDGSVDLGINKSSGPHKHIKGCYFSMCQLVLLPNGDVTICCADLNSRGVIGNIKKNTLFEIYKSKKRRKIIELNLAGRRNQIPLCQNCVVE